MSVLIDTGAWFALANRADTHHARARAFYLDGLTTHVFITTNVVVVETWALINARLGRPSAMTFWDSLRRSGLRIVPISEHDLQRAWEITQEWQDQPFSLVDCTTFSIMERMGISHAFAFDDHFLIYRYGPNRSRAFVRLP